MTARKQASRRPATSAAEPAQQATPETAVVEVELAADGRPRCVAPLCTLPEVADGYGLCGGHYATRPDLRKGARRV